MDPEFTIVMRGYERHEVDAYLQDLMAETEQLADRVAKLESDLAAARADADRGTSPESSFKQLGEETTRILVAAESAAREMRAKAEREADAAVATAEQAARDRVESASAHAEEIVAEAETRQREIEAEIRRLDDVRASMVDSLRAAITTTTRAIEQAPPSAVQTGGGDAAPTEEAEAEVDDPEPAAVVAVAVDEVDEADTKTDEVEPEADEVAPAPEAVTEPVADVEESDDEVDDVIDITTDDDPAAVAEALAAELDDAADHDEPEATSDDHRGGADPDALESALTDADVAAGRAAPPEVVDGTDAGLLRERSLAGVRPGMLRRLRRSLQELQNGVLESVRTRDEDTEVADLLPTDAETDTLAEVARVFLDAGYRAGRADAPVFLGEEAPVDPPTDATRVADAADQLAMQLLSELRTTLTPSLRAGVDADEPDASLSERVGEVFRDLKGPIVETVVDRHLTRTYGEATLDGWTDAGCKELLWVLGDETRCPEGMCRGNEAEGPVGIGTTFPSGHHVPLAHDGCTCALRPA